MSTSIVIPVYGRWDLCHQLLFDIYKNCSLVEEVIIVNNGNDSKNPDVLKGLSWWKSTNMLPIEVIDLAENIGFLRASNLGLQHAVEDNVFLISTDVRIHKDFVDYVNKFVNIENALLGDRLLDWDTGWNTVKGVTYPYLEGYFLGASRSTWKELGYFDDLFAPNDMEDVDLSATARRLGFELVKLPEGYISHLGAQTIGYGEEREAITRKNKEKFEKKWS